MADTHPLRKGVRDPKRALDSRPSCMSSLHSVVQHAIKALATIIARRPEVPLGLRPATAGGQPLKRGALAGGRRRSGRQPCTGKFQQQGRRT